MALKVKFLFFMIVFLIFSISTYGIIIKHIPAYTSRYIINISGVADVNESKLNLTIDERIDLKINYSFNQSFTDTLYWDEDGDSGLTGTYSGAYDINTSGNIFAGDYLGLWYGINYTLFPTKTNMIDNDTATNASIKDYADKTFVKNNTDASLTGLIVDGNTPAYMDYMNIGLFNLSGNINLSTSAEHLQNDSVKNVSINYISTSSQYVKTLPRITPTPVPESGSDDLPQKYFIEFINGTLAGNRYLIKRTDWAVNTDRFYFDVNILNLSSGDVSVKDGFKVLEYKEGTLNSKNVKTETLNVTETANIESLITPSISGLNSLTVDGDITSRNQDITSYTNQDTQALRITQYFNGSSITGDGIDMTIDTFPGFDTDIRKHKGLTIYHQVDGSYTKTIYTLYGVKVNPQLGTNGNTTNLYGYIFQPNVISAKMTNVYGMYITMSNFTNVVGNRYSIYALDGDIYSGGNIETPDDTKYYSGSANDVSTYFNASDYIIKAEVGSPNLYFQSFDNLYFNNTRFCFENGTNCNITAAGVSGDYPTKTELQANLTALNNTVMETVYNGTLAYSSYVDSNFIKNNTDVKLKEINATENIYPQKNITFPLGAVITEKNESGVLTLCLGWGC